MLKDMDFYPLQENIKIQLLDAGIDPLKTASKKLVQKAGEFLGNKITDTVTKSNDHKIVKPDENPRNVEEIIIPLEKRDEILSKLTNAL